MTGEQGGALAPTQQQDQAMAPGHAFSSAHAFEGAQRMAKALAASSMVPQDYQGNTANTLVALEMSQRTGSSPLAVMQNMHIIQGRPSWSSQFVIAALNSCGRFSPLRFSVRSIGKKSVQYETWTGQKGNRKKENKSIDIEDRGFTAWAYDKAGGEVLEGPEVTLEMAVKEGWYTKPDSKWQTMPDMMGRYRAAKFFGNLYAPDILMGMATAEEAEDIGPPKAAGSGSTARPGMAEPQDTVPPTQAPPAEPGADQPDAGEAVEGELVDAEPEEPEAGEAPGMAEPQGEPDAQQTQQDQPEAAGQGQGLW